MQRIPGAFLSLLLAGAVLVAAPAACLGSGGDGRRVAAELLVLSGDVARLSAPGLSPARRKGLAERIGGGLAALDLLLRLADEEAGRTPHPGAHARSVAALRGALAAGDLAALAAGLRTLAAGYPLQVPAILPLVETPARRARGKALHERLCAGCHDGPADAEAERPAMSLFAEARRLSPAEFAARMLIGIRGDVVTGISNPFSDEEIASLMVYYRADPASRP